MTDQQAHLAEPTVPLPPMAEKWPHRGYAWYVVVALMIAYAFSIVDRIGLGLLVQPIEADLHISDSLMGLLQGTAFAVFYSLFGLPIGLLADRLNRKRIVTAGITIWSAATMVCGLVSGFPGLFLSRIAVGAGEATLSPAGTSMIADYFPVDERPKAYGVYAIGTSIGSGMAFLLGGLAIGLANRLRLEGPSWLAAFAAWKIVFLLIGVPGLVVGILFGLTVREPARHNFAAAHRLSFAPLGKLLAAEWRVYATLIAGAVLNTTAIYASVGWFPTLLIRIDGMAPAEIGRLLGTYGVPCGVLSCLGSGWVAAWLERRGRADASVLVALVGSFWYAAAGIVAALVFGATPAIVFYCVQSLASNCCAVSTLTALNRITPNALRGQVISLFALSVGLIALSLGPLAVGALSDHVFGAPDGIGDGLATVMAVCGVLGVACFIVARPGYRRLAEQNIR